MRLIKQQSEAKLENDMEIRDELEENGEKL
jgi:hypothetical protein